MSLLILAAAVAALPRPGELKTFGDWIVGCDNSRACEARALIPEGKTEGWSVLELRRAADGPAVPTVTIVVDDAAMARTLSAAGARQALTPGREDQMILPAAFVPKLTQAARTAAELQVLDAQGRVSSRISLKGAAAALLWLDDQQKRVGTVTALARPGPRPAAAVPVPPALPHVIAAIAPSPKPPARMTPKALRQAYGDDACTKANGREDEAPSYDRLDATHTLALVPLICVSGAYNITINAYVVTDGRQDAPALAIYEKVLGDDQEGVSVLDMNTGWDARTRRLSVGFKGRGLGDCGVWRDYAWDGRQFRFVNEEAMGECRGAMRPIPTWRSVVTSR